MDMTDPAVESYIQGLVARRDEPVLLEMEAEAEERGFPIIGRMCGVVIEILARGIGAKRVFELGSGYGYSAYWFVRATGPDGEVHLTDGDPANEKKALDYLGRAGFAAPITFHVGDAVTSLEAVDGEWDAIFCDIDKHVYPDAWAAARQFPLDQLVDERREVRSVPLLEVWPAPIVARHDPATALRSAPALEVPLAHLGLEQRVVDRELLATRDRAACSEPERVVHPDV